LLIAGEDIEELTNDLNIIIIFRRGFCPHRRIFINFGLVINGVVVDDVRQIYKDFTIYYIRKKKLVIFTALSSLNPVIFYLLFRVTEILNIRNLYRNWERVFSTFDLFISLFIIKIIASNRSSIVKTFFFNFPNLDLPRFLFLILNLIFCPFSGSEIFWISIFISALRFLFFV
jgi:hypothetical protein